MSQPPMSPRLEGRSSSLTKRLRTRPTMSSADAHVEDRHRLRWPVVGLSARPCTPAVFAASAEAPEPPYPDRRVPNWPRLTLVGPGLSGRAESPGPAGRSVMLCRRPKPSVLVPRRSRCLAAMPVANSQRRGQPQPDLDQSAGVTGGTEGMTGWTKRSPAHWRDNHADPGVPQTS